LSREQGKKFVISKQEPQVCEYCGKIAELRPYGKNGANICFQCGMDNIEETKKQFADRLEEVDKVAVVKANILN
jgi:hypothetical protein